MDIRSFFKPKSGNRSNGTKKPLKKANDANNTAATSKSKSEYNNDKKKPSSISSPYFLQPTSSISKTKTSGTGNPEINNRNCDKHAKEAEIDSDTTDDGINVVRKVAATMTKKKLKKAAVDLDATTDEELGDNNKKIAVRKKKKVETDSDATTDDNMDTGKIVPLPKTKNAEVDLDATTDDEMHDIRRKSMATKKNTVEADLDITTDENEDHKKGVIRKEEVQNNLDDTTDEEMEDINEMKMTLISKKNETEIDLDATTDEDIEYRNRKKTNTKTNTTMERKDKIKNYSDTNSDSDYNKPPPTPNRSHGKRAGDSAKKRKAFIDDDSIEPDDHDDSDIDIDDDFEVKSFKKQRTTSKRRGHSTKSAKARLPIEDKDHSEDGNESDDEFVVEDNNKEESEEENFASDTDDDYIPMTQPSKKKSSTKSPPKSRITMPSPASKRKPTEPKSKPKPKPKPRTKARPKPSPKKKPKKEAPPKPTQSLTSYPHASATPQCLSGYTFVFTGNMPDLPRDTAEEYVKILGGRVTTAVSGKTNYLVCGEILEDDRPVEEGSKFRKASSLGEDTVCILRGGGDFYGVVKLLDDRKREEDGDCDDNGNGNNGATPTPAKVSSSSKIDVQAVTKNPYARSKTNNPYARPTNPYTKRSSLSVSSSIDTPSSSSKRQRTSLNSNDDNKTDISNDPNALWADKYAPQSTNGILGNGESVKKLTRWLSSWEDTFNMPQTGGKKRSFGGPTGPRKAALLSGPPGIGKTTTAVLVGKESGRHVLEMNASDTRSKKSLETGLGDVTGSQVLSFKSVGVGGKKRGKSHVQKRCIIMDEVDGMGAGDRSGMSELIKMIKTSQVPIICICNDRQSQKMRSLVPYCLDLRYRRPVKTVIARRALEIGNMEGMNVESNAAEAIAESCGNDIRQVLNVMQMWANKKHEHLDKRADMTYKDLKARNSFISKDEILRVSMFDATKLIVEGRRGLQDADPKTEVNSLFKRTDAFFTDYSLMGLNVHQNYLKVLISPFQKTRVSGDAMEELKCLENMAEATRSMSDFAVAENSLRVEQNWSLLPFCSSLAVKCGHHAGGESGGFLPGYPEFAGWLGKNSSRARKLRLLQELSHHMNYKISAGGTDLRLGYLPVFRMMFVNLLTSGDGSKVTNAIQFMDEYGLDRDDVFENLDEFTLDSKAKKMSDLDSKAKAAFTREYNKGIHKSQALVDEQGVTKTRRKVATIDEDGDNNEDVESEEEAEDDIESLQKLFKKRKSTSSRKKPMNTKKKR